MEIEQTKGQASEQDWRRGAKVSGNPAGQRGHLDRIAAAAADFVADFKDRHGREPTRSETARIETAADLRVNSKRRGIALEDKAKLANAAERILRKLGIDRPAPAPAKPSPMRPSAYEILHGEAGK